MPGAVEVLIVSPCYFWPRCSEVIKKKWRRQLKQILDKIRKAKVFDRFSDVASLGYDVRSSVRWPWRQEVLRLSTRDVSLFGLIKDSKKLS